MGNNNGCTSHPSPQRADRVAPGPVGVLRPAAASFSFGGQMGTGVLWLLGGESRIGMYGGARPRTRLLGRQTFRPQSASE